MRADMFLRCKRKKRSTPVQSNHIHVLYRRQFFFCHQREIKMYDTVIKNVRILDGSGAPWYRGDIGIQDGKIQKIGNISQKEKIIDGNDLYAAPGFIDIHSHSDTTATNALYRHYGNERIIRAFGELGLEGTQFNRAYYDDERESRGIQNYFVPKEIGMLLEKMYRRTLKGVYGYY